MRKAIFLLPVAVWLGIFWSYWAGQPAMTLHGMDYYLIIKYQMDSLMRGVFPFWDPLMFWGRPDNIDSRFIGEFNPFLWIYAVLAWVGVPRPTAFLTYAVGYYFVGLAGFYLLAQMVFRDTVWAWLSFILFLFSSFLILIFNNYCVTLMAVPAIWFFYFLVAFAQTPKRVFFVGLVFTGMLLAITYMPFYFATILLVIFGSFFTLYPREVSNIVLKWSKLPIKYGFIVILGSICVIISLIPGLQWFLSSESGEYILSWRHAGSDSLNAAAMELSTISTTGIIGPVDFKWLFSGLQYSRHMLFFVPVFIFPVLLLSLVNRVSKRAMVILLSWLALFLITLTDVTPVHKFLYEHIYFYKLFRNIFYLSYMALIPLLILFTVEQLRLFLENVKKVENRKPLILYTVAVHALFALFLMNEGNIIWTSYASVLLSLIFFLGILRGGLKEKHNAFIVLLGLAAVIQPAQVFYHYRENAPGVVDWYPTDRFYPKFSYVRPTRAEDAKLPKVYKGKSPAGVQDTSGFEPWKYTGLNRNFQLHENVDHDVLEEYVKYKFILYDETQIVQQDMWDFKRFENAIRKQENLAFVFFISDKFALPQQKASKPRYQPVTTDSPEFRVTDFDLNHIRFETNFSTDKFVVYNDGYDRHWKATVNGKPHRILRTNYAFKGVWLPAGENTVELRYGLGARYVFNWLMFLIYALVLVYLIMLSVNYRRGKGD